MRKVVYRKILVTHDGSKLASAAIPHVNTLANLLGAEVILLQVVPTVEQEIAGLVPVGIPPTVYSPIPADEALAKEIIKDKVKRAKAGLEEIKAQLEENHTGKVSIIVQQGIDTSKIVSTAKKQHCDLIVISTHGRSGLRRVLLGSVADYVIRHASCPILVVRPEGEKYDS
ncbi:MAG: universal stress protein [Candidatus Curtissbacteria bacterium]|nr:universal stress protein [Candidatus Curtissbacteria bacterium]